MSSKHSFLCLLLIALATAETVSPDAKQQPRLLTARQRSQETIDVRALDSVSLLHSEEFSSLSDENSVFEQHPGLRLSVLLAHLLLLTCAAYTCFFSYRHYKLLLTVQGFLATFYFAMLTMRHAGIFKPERVSHQVGLLVAAAFVAANLLLVCSVFIRLNYAFFGFAATTVLFCLLEERAFAGLSRGVYLAVFLGLFSAGTALFGFLTYRFFKVAIQVNSACVGGFYLVLCLEVIARNYSAFYDPEVNSRESLGWLLASWAVAAASGFVFQLRMKQISDKQARDSDLEEINRRSYLA